MTSPGGFFFFSRDRNVSFPFDTLIHLAATSQENMNKITIRAGLAAVEEWINHKGEAPHCNTSAKPLNVSAVLEIQCSIF